MSVDVTIVCVPRERFSFTKSSLESLYDNTIYPFDLIYIDNCSPPEISHYLRGQATDRKFRLIHSQHYLSPNQARNLGLSYVNSKYVVFLDNDVLVKEGWLTELVNCAEETRAAIVGPLVCQHQPLHSIIHCAGGEYMDPESLDIFLSEDYPNASSKLTISEKIYMQNQMVSEVNLQRTLTGFVEFHCMLVRTSLFKEIGRLDEKLTCTKEYLDICMSASKVGQPVYLEPASVVTFMTHFPAPALEQSDIYYYSLRWSDAWEKASLKHFQYKWNLEERPYFSNRYKRLGWRRRIEIVKPFAQKFQFLGQTTVIWIERVATRLEKIWNFWISFRHSLL